MLTPRERSPLPEKKLQFSPGEYRSHDTASSRTASPTHYQQAIPAAPVVNYLPMETISIFPACQNRPYEISLCSFPSFRPLQLRMMYAPDAPDRLLCLRTRFENDSTIEESYLEVFPAKQMSKNLNLLTDTSAMQDDG